MTEPDPEANAATGTQDTGRGEAADVEVTGPYGASGAARVRHIDEAQDTVSSAGESEGTGQALELPAEPDADQPLVRADNLDYGSGDRRLFAGLSFAIPAGSFAVVTGPAGFGKSTLLLALAGRMDGLAGRLQIAGRDAITRPRGVRTITSVARIDGLAGLEPQHRVIDAISDRAGIDGLSRARARDAFENCCAELDVEFGPKQRVHDLDLVQQGLLAAILATLRSTQLVVFDDLDNELSVDDQGLLAAALLRLARNGTTVVASSVEPAIAGEHNVWIPLPSTNRR